jgi:hypothetical protein
MRIRDPGWKKIRIRDAGWKSFGSGIRDKHPGSAILMKDPCWNPDRDPDILVNADPDPDFGWKNLGKLFGLLMRKVKKIRKIRQSSAYLISCYKFTISTYTGTGTLTIHKICLMFSFLYQVIILNPNGTVNEELMLANGMTLETIRAVTDAATGTFHLVSSLILTYTLPRRYGMVRRCTGTIRSYCYGLENFE